MTSVVQEGLVIAHLGQGIAVEASDDVVLCQTRRQLETVAVGDKVMWSAAAPGQGRIEQILPRRSLLARPSNNAKVRPVAANIDTVFIVFAVEPVCDFLLIDQYLAVCENKAIEAALVFNKIDLASSEAIEQELAIYQTLGYSVFRLSVKTAVGMADFRQALKDRVSILAGQSGVGKSSITNAIIPDKKLKINAVSETTKHGRHTTTAATLYHIGDDGGDLIDSPGVSIFGLADLSEPQLAFGYREFQPLLGQCQFNDCRHVNDKGCAIRSASEQGQIAPSRYQRFLKLREKMPKNA